MYIDISKGTFFLKNLENDSNKNIKAIKNIALSNIRLTRNMIVYFIILLIKNYLI